MNVFVRSITQVLKGAVKGFQTFPVAIISAIAFAIVTMIRIQLDWPQQESYNFLFNCLHWSFATGAIFSLAVITGAQSRINNFRAFLIANLLGAAAAVITFLGLYLFGGLNQAMTGANYVVISSLAATRVGAVILVSLIAFVYLAGYPKEQSDFSRSLFMTLKAFFIALLYGLVIMSGTSAVAAAIRALLYSGMSDKVYMYISTISGFLTFTMFVGYFPSFRKGVLDEHREIAQKQPRFVEVLFEFIMIPIVLAMTVVLILWAGRTVISGMSYSFVQLSGIATSYAAAGILLHVLTTRYETGLAKFYRLIYPVTALIILAFQAWALLIQLQKSGLKTTEYFFSVIWILAVVSAVLLIILKARSHAIIAGLICVMGIFSVLPVVGYQALPVTSQVNRLENLLTSQGILVNGQLIPAATEPDKTVRESITDVVGYLAQAENAKLPAWFDKHLSESTTFTTKLGFTQTWPAPSDVFGGGYRVTSLVLQPEAIDISGYQWAVDLQTLLENSKGQSEVTLKGVKGSYRINWTFDGRTGKPNLKLYLDNRMILEQNMNAYIERITAAYPPAQSNPPRPATLKDMSLQLETSEVSLLLVFSNINIDVNPNQDDINYWLNVSALYLKEK